MIHKTVTIPETDWDLVRLALDKADAREHEIAIDTKSQPFEGFKRVNHNIQFQLDNQHWARPA